MGTDTVSVSTRRQSDMVPNKPIREAMARHNISPYDVACALYDTMRQRQDATTRISRALGITAAMDKHGEHYKQTHLRYDTAVSYVLSVGIDPYEAGV